MIAAAHVHAILALAAATPGSSRREHAEDDLEGGRSRSEPDRIVIHDLKPGGSGIPAGLGLATEGPFRANGRARDGDLVLLERARGGVSLGCIIRFG